MDDLRPERVEVPDVAPGERPEGPTVDWSALDPGGPGDLGRPDATDTGGGLDARAERPLLDPADARVLDPTRERVPVSDLHPSHLRGPLPTEQAGIERAYEAGSGPQDWLPAVNPAVHADMASGAPDHTTNCADAARAVQSTLEGRPTAAGAISPDGLPLAGQEPGGGEARAYTEQWAGRHAESAGYGEIGDRVAATQGSAIVFADAGDGTPGHAFNALWDADRQSVLWADGQTGEVGDWPPDHLRAWFPETEAIFFPDPRRPR